MNPWLPPGALCLIIAGTIWIVRYRSEEYRESLTEKQRFSRMAGFGFLAIAAPWPLIFLLIQIVSNYKPFRSMPEDVRLKWLFAIATVGSAAGLPFGIKLLRTIRGDAQASATSIMLSGYGVVVWVIFFIMLTMIFAQLKSCC